MDVDTTHTKINNLARILIVDDNSDMREYITLILNERWNVETAPHGDAALELLRKKKFDLVITDIMMPKLDGYGLVKTLRADPVLQNIPIIVLSARSGLHTQVESLDLGANDYLIKPFAVEEVLARVSAHLKQASRYQLAAENERLLKEKENAERDSHAKNLFLATLSHELRTPLTAILCWLGALKHTNYDLDKVKQALLAIEENVLLQTELVNNLLDVSTILCKKMSFALEELNLIDLIKASILSMQEKAKEKNLVIQFFPSTEPQILLLNYKKMVQVFNNLLSNAIKFTNSPGVITIWLEISNENIRIHIQDSGIGISAEFLPLLFKPFAQSDASLSRSQSGLGLGLVLVRNLLELQGGTIAAHSEGLNKGTLFTITFTKKGG